MPKFMTLLWKPLGLIGLGALLFGLPTLFPAIWMANALPWLGGITIAIGLIRFLMGKQ